MSTAPIPSLMLVAQPEATISLPQDTLICIGGAADLIAVSSIPELDLEDLEQRRYRSVQQVSPVRRLYTVFMPRSSRVQYGPAGNYSSRSGFIVLRFHSPKHAMQVTVEIAATSISGGLAPYVGIGVRMRLRDYSRAASQWLAPP